ncbi:MAG: copper amine oxidase N-terminal domain-containing protein [Hominilimicola sp.]
MKKIIALALTAAMAMSCAVNAQAADRISGIHESTKDHSEIHILYNDTVVQYEDVKPVNTDGRVMIPFRAALENMGAAVDYNDAERLVTAKKGDITINFTLMDDTIYIDKNGQQSTITMDVPMIIVEDRTLVPIRFMSNAFDMQVGWDGKSETVVIMDYDDYFNKFSSIAPNMTKLINLKQPEFNKGTTSFDMKTNLTKGEEAFNFDCSGKADSTYADGTAQMKIAGINAEFAGVSLLNDADAEAIVKEGQLYVKTDIMEQFAKNSTNTELKLAASTFNSNTWYKIDLKKVIDALDIPAETKAVFEAVLAMLSGETVDIAEMLKSGISTEGDANIDEAVMLAAQFDMLEQLDKYISVTEKDNGGYAISMNILPEDFNKIIIGVFGSILTDEERAQLSDMIRFVVSASTDCDGQKAVSDASVDLGINVDGTELVFKLTISETQEKDSTVKAASIPENSTDITDKLLGAVK